MSELFKEKPRGLQVVLEQRLRDLCRVPTEAKSRTRPGQARIARRATLLEGALGEVSLCAMAISVIVKQRV
jgi:hypothetical protein